MLTRRSFFIGCCAAHASFTNARAEEGRGFACGTVDTFTLSGRSTPIDPYGTSSDWKPQDLEVTAAQQGLTPYGTINVADRWRVTDGLTPGTGLITLGVCFLNGSSSQQAVVERGARRWLSGDLGKKLDFRFGVPQEQSQISVSFGDVGNNSIVGRTSASYARHRASMNIESVYEYIAAHEFGHAIGLQHEHQNPGYAIEWNTEVVVQEMARQGWSREMVEDNIFSRFPQSYACLGAKPDPYSIMLYPIPPGWAKNYQSGTNTAISNEDFRCLSAVYRA